MVGRGSGDAGKNNYIVSNYIQLGKKSPWICREHVLKLLRVDVLVLRSPCGSDKMMVVWTKLVVER